MGGAPNVGPSPTAGGEVVQRPQAGRLGLGLGLNRFQRGKLLQAGAQGPSGVEDFLATRQGLAQRIRGMEQNNPGRWEKFQTFAQTGMAPSGAQLRTGPRPVVQPPAAGPTPEAPTPETPPVDRPVETPAPEAPPMERPVEAAPVLGREEARDQRQEARQGFRQQRRQAIQGARGNIRAANQTFRQQNRGLR